MVEKSKINILIRKSNFRYVCERKEWQPLNPLQSLSWPYIFKNFPAILSPVISDTDRPYPKPFVSFVVRSLKAPAVSCVDCT